MTNSNITDRTLVDLLKELVTTETRLAITTREAHWNVTGSAFFSLHGMFGEHYTTLDGFIDDLAERVRQLGSLVSGSPLMGVTELTSDADTLLNYLGEKHAKATKLLKRAIQLAQDRQDEGTADMCTAMLEQHEKMMWMIRASVSVQQPALINIQA